MGILNRIGGKKDTAFTKKGRHWGNLLLLNFDVKDPGINYFRQVLNVITMDADSPNFWNVLKDSMPGNTLALIKMDPKFFKSRKVTAEKIRNGELNTALSESKLVDLMRGLKSHVGRLWCLIHFDTEFDNQIHTALSIALMQSDTGMGANISKEIKLYADTHNNRQKCWQEILDQAGTIKKMQEKAFEGIENIAKYSEDLFSLDNERLFGFDDHLYRKANGIILWTAKFQVPFLYPLIPYVLGFLVVVIILINLTLGDSSQLRGPLEHGGLDAFFNQLAESLSIGVRITLRFVEVLLAIPLIWAVGYAITLIIMSFLYRRNIAGESPFSAAMEKIHEIKEWLVGVLITVLSMELLTEVIKILHHFSDEYLLRFVIVVGCLIILLLVYTFILKKHSHSRPGIKTEISKNSGENH